jgi:retron-type reverse transcriptase
MPKTIKNVYDEAVTFEKLLQAHKKARRGKREKKNVILVELKLEQELLRLEQELKTGTYHHGGYKTFTIYEPKERTIMASDYVDRIVHQWYVENFIKPYFVPQFIQTSYACLEKKGMHKASKDLQLAMRKAKDKWGDYYILKMDVTKYFQNIDKRILWDILKRKIKDKKLLWLTREILLSTKGMVGLPLGNYTSQMFANIYLNELDQYSKHQLKCKYYFRYMDDVVILCENKEIAKQKLAEITEFLANHLRLTLNSKTRIFKSIQGVNFCGYQINEKRLKIRHTSKCRMKRKLKKYTRLLKEGKMTLPDIQKSIAGWLGYVKHADSYQLRKSMFYIEG